MPDPFTNSAHALADAILEELDRAENNTHHATIHVTCRSRRLANGIDSCSVQLQCDAGCGWLFEDYGEQAGILERKATHIQKILNEAIENPRSLSEILNEVFPESVIKNPPPTRNGPKRIIV